MAAWKGSLLSIMGRVQLVRSIIHGMIAYSLHIYEWPSSLLKKLDRWIRNFIWSCDIHYRRIVTVAWEKVCSPLEVGGLGLRSLKSMNSGALLKLTWEVMSSDQDWAVLLRSRFF